MKIAGFSPLSPALWEEDVCLLELDEPPHHRDDLERVLFEQVLSVTRNL